MARPLRIEYPGAVYHVTSRGDGREDIFLTDLDREQFLEVLEHVIDRHGWQCHAWCLMSNHYHLMIETPKGNLGQGMRQLNGVYTQRFNRKHERVGHVFQGRYKAILIEKDAHLLELCRYIVRNPVAADMVENVAGWPWSSYLQTGGLAKRHGFTSTAWVLEQFGDSRKRYREYVADASLKDSPLKELSGSNVLGSEEFRGEVQKCVKAHPEVPRIQRHVMRPALQELSENAAERGAWMAEAYREHGYTMRQIADFVQVHYSLVSKIIKEWEGR